MLLVKLLDLALMLSKASHLVLALLGGTVVQANVRLGLLLALDNLFGITTVIHSLCLPLPCTEAGF